jgi:hypothetical protein
MVFISQESAGLATGIRPLAGLPVMILSVVRPRLLPEATF